MKRDALARANKITETIRKHEALIEKLSGRDVIVVIQEEENHYPMPITTIGITERSEHPDAEQARYFVKLLIAKYQRLIDGLEQELADL